METVHRCINVTFQYFVLTNIMSLYFKDSDYWRGFLFKLFWSDIREASSSHKTSKPNFNCSSSISSLHYSILRSWAWPSIGRLISSSGSGYSSRSPPRFRMGVLQRVNICFFSLFINLIFKKKSPLINFTFLQGKEKGTSLSLSCRFLSHIFRLQRRNCHLCL